QLASDVDVAARNRERVVDRAVEQSDGERGLRIGQPRLQCDVAAHLRHVVGLRAAHRPAKFLQQLLVVLGALPGFGFGYRRAGLLGLDGDRDERRYGDTREDGPPGAANSGSGHLTPPRLGRLPGCTVSGTGLQQGRGSAVPAQRRPRPLGISPLARKRSSRILRSCFALLPLSWSSSSRIAAPSASAAARGSPCAPPTGSGTT